MLIKDFWFRLMDFFSCIDFGAKANQFLRSCGVKDEPSPIQLVEFLVEFSDSFLEETGRVDEYTLMLQKIFLGFNSIKVNPNILHKIVEAPILLGKTING